MKNRIRFGIRVPLFRNLGVMVFYASPEATQQFGAAVDVVRTILQSSGIDGSQIIFDASPASNPPKP